MGDNLLLLIYFTSGMSEVRLPKTPLRAEKPRASSHSNGARGIVKFSTALNLH
jgi:hypothetical protein